jgi:AraC-like DNA-binding protein
MGYHHVRAHHVFHPKLIEYYGLHFIGEGSLTLRYGEQVLTFAKGDFFCIYPGIVYHMQPPEETVEIFWLSINGEQVSILLEEVDVTASNHYIRNAISMELEMLLRNLFGKPYHESRQAKLGLYAAIYCIFSLMAPVEENAKTKPGPDEWMPRCLEYMHTHFSESINVQDVADYLAIHRVYFTKVFTRYVGMAPIQYLQKLRMDRALHLLQHTTRTVTEIALSLGYPELYAFTRAFSNYYGAPPSTHR